jgi:alkenylglycerophosphocholine/alkenylglycerophosphoethanolamine hydrolase
MVWVLVLFLATLYLSTGGLLGPWAPLLKAAPAAVLAVSVFRARPGRERRLGGFGLCVSAFADAIIEASFIGGLATFLLAHLLYIAAFTWVEPRARLIRLLPVAAWAALALPVLVGHAGPLRVPVLVYGLVIFTMIWRAAAAVSSVGWNPGTLGLAGAVLFGFSDSLLGYNRFVDPVAGSRVVVLATYWLGQMLIARSFLERRPPLAKKAA